MPTLTQLKRPSSHALYSDELLPSSTLFHWRPSRWLVFPIIFCQMLNYGIIRPSIPILELRFFQQSYAESSLVGGTADALGALLSFMLMPLLGTYSDTAGRKPILLLTLLLNTLPVLTLTLYPHYLSLWWFFGVQVVSKLSTFSSVYAYLADVTIREQRGDAYAQMSGIVFLALAIGPAISSVTSMQTSFIIAVLLSVINLLYCHFIMPESLPSLVYRPLLSPPTSPSLIPLANQPSPPVRHLSPFSTITFALRSRLYSLIFSMVLFEQLAMYGIGEIFLLYLMDVLRFTRRDNIHLGIAQGVASIVVMLVLLPLISHRLGEKRIILISIVLYLAWTCAYPFVTTRTEVFSLLTLTSLSTMSYPATSSLLSIHTGPTHQGLAQGALSGIRSLALGLGPLLFAVVFAATTREGHVQAPWLAFVLAAALTAVSLGIAMKLPEKGGAGGGGEKGRGIGGLGGRGGTGEGDWEGEGEGEGEGVVMGTYGAVSEKEVDVYGDVEEVKEGVQSHGREERRQLL